MIELLVVIAIIAILAAILFPVFARAKAAAKKTACLSNLSQIGKGIGLYMIDSDDIFPFAVDPSDKYAMDIWAGHPDWMAQIPNMPFMHDALQPYVKSMDVFHCPADSGSYVLDNHFPEAFYAQPTMYKTYGCSYFFRTEIAFRQYSSTSFQLPANVNIMFDGAGHWHSAMVAGHPDDSYQEFASKLVEYRYNTVFGDLHAKSLNFDQLGQAWATEL